MGVTRWRRLAVADGRTRIEFSPLTGRTHQLRLHAAHALGLGFPIVGDRLYGHGREGEQMLLHASHLAFAHPSTGEPISFDSWLL
jgi:tRNA pseudouridine32 synthase/23S rRNA pseudouridine746 synthase